MIRVLRYYCPVLYYNFNPRIINSVPNLWGNKFWPNYSLKCKKKKVFSHSVFFVIPGHSIRIYNFLINFQFFILPLKVYHYIVFWKSKNFHFRSKLLLFVQSKLSILNKNYFQILGSKFYYYKSVNYSASTESFRMSF